MHVPSPPRSSARAEFRDPAWRGRLTLLVLAAVLTWPMLVASEFRPWQLFDPQALAAVSGFLASFVPPATAPVPGRSDGAHMDKGIAGLK